MMATSFADGTKISMENAVVANAKGGLSTTSGKVDKTNMFGDTELQHIYVADICPENN